MKIDLKTLFNKVGFLSLLGFYLFNGLVAFCYIVPWFKEWGVIEDPLLFMPRWLVFFFLIPVLLFNFALFFKQKYLFLSTLIFTVFFYLNVQIPNFSASSEQSAVKLRVMSVNLGGLKGEKFKITAQFKYGKPNIIAFQETGKALVEKLVPKSWFVHCTPHMCFASQYEVEFLNSQSRNILGGWGTVAALYRLNVGGRSIYVANVHFETPRKGFDDVELMNLNFKSMRKYFEQRYYEALIVDSWISNKSPLIIAGDFNMTVESSIYREHFSKFKNTFNEKGFGLGHTKFTNIHGVRIDHILVDEHFQTVNAWVDGAVGSDHRPIYADLLLVD